MQDFKSLGVSEEVSNKLKKEGIVTPSPIQEQCIPLILSGDDVIAQAQTGTGKTFAFLLPILEKLIPGTSYVQSLIVTPTRELALQITEEVQKLIIDLEDVNVLTVYGGQDVEKQLKKLKNGVQIVVGTPGRIVDHIRRETLQLSRLTTLVLDEADQMLHIGFQDEMELIIKQTPVTRQTLLFSATISEEIRKLANKYMRQQKYIQIEKKQGPAVSVSQVAVHTTDRGKQGVLLQLIEQYRPYLAVVFCRTKRRVSKLYGVLKEQGYSCAELHGDISQAKREQVMKLFRKGDIQLLVATDVAARGLDVDGVTHVFNYDIPLDAESYVHRIGRTGRAGSKGYAITLYTSENRSLLDEIERDLNTSIPKNNIGNIETASKSKQNPTKKHDPEKKKQSTHKSSQKRKPEMAKQQSKKKAQHKKTNPFHTAKPKAKSKQRNKR